MLVFPKTIYGEFMIKSLFISLMLLVGTAAYANDCADEVSNYNTLATLLDGENYSLYEGSYLALTKSGIPAKNAKFQNYLKEDCGERKAAEVRWAASNLCIAYAKAVSNDELLVYGDEFIRTLGQVAYNYPMCFNMLD